MKVAILIPAYNEANNMRDTLTGISFNRKDIIVVDDGSTDNTGEIAKQEGATVLYHSYNMGKGRAHRTGFKYISNNGYDYLITMDADGQHSPEEILLFKEGISENKEDLIIGTRKLSLKDMPLLRYFTNFTTSFFVSLLCGKRVKDSQSGFRAIRTEIVEKVSLSTSRFQTESELIIKTARLGYKIGFLPIKTIYQKNGVSYIHPLKDTIRFILLAISSFWW